MTTLLIVLPFAAALIIWVLPLNDVSAGALALLAALAEVGVWIQLVARYDFSEGGLQFAQQWNWFSDLNVSYHVGVYGFSVWLIGLTVVAMAAAIAYGFWAGRERVRAYMGLMLFLTGATVGVFVSQDLLLFYAFFEAMLIPLYVLIGVWGGPGRLGATSSHWRNAERRAAWIAATAPQTTISVVSAFPAPTPDPPPARGGTQPVARCARRLPMVTS